MPNLSYFLKINNEINLILLVLKIEYCICCVNNKCVLNI